MSAIYYASWDGRTWSMPVDIVAARGQGEMSFYKGLAATPNGSLLLAWSEGRDISLAVAPADSAASAQAWHVIYSDQGSNPALAVNRGGSHWYLAYWHDARTLVYTWTSNHGDTWSEEQVVWTAGENAAGSSLAAVAGQAGELYLVWTENAERRTWSGEAIWHAVIDPMAGSPQVREVARSSLLEQPTLDGPNITECPNGQLHIAWNNGVGSMTGRFHQWWDPETRRWSQVEAIFPGLSGQTSKPGLVCDNTGRVHWLSSAQGPSQSGFTNGLRYATWYEGQWSAYQTLWGGAYHGERPSMAILGGDEVHLTWQLFTLDGEPVNMVAHSYRAIDAASEEPVAIARPALTATRSPMLTSTPAAMTPTLDPPVLNGSPSAGDGRFATMLPLIGAIVAVLPIVGAVLWVTRRRSR